jgi:hypothetical protein
VTRGARSSPIAARKITVFCPIAAETLAALARGELEALAHDASAGPLLAFLESCPELGRLGAYSGVCEISLGLEAFTPLAAARPTQGLAGERSHSATAVLTTYAPASIPATRLEAILSELVRLHPWEVPVIEVSPVDLIAVPAAASGPPGAPS